MSAALEKEAEKALEEYLTAEDEYHQLLGPARRLIPGQQIVFECWDENYFKKLEEAEAKIAETKKKWIDVFRRLAGERQSL